MYNKKAQGMPMNVIIIAILVLVVLVILVAFFAGGFGSVVGKIRDLFTGQTTGQARDIVVQTCVNLCESAKQAPTVETQMASGYCKASFVVDADSNSNTLPERMICGNPANPDIAALKDDPKKVNPSGASIGIDCPEISC